MQEKFRAKGNKLYFDFVDLQKAFDMVPREVIRWALHKLGVEEWLVSAVMSMYIIIIRTRSRRWTVALSMPHDRQLLSRPLCILVQKQLMVTVTVLR